MYVCEHRMIPVAVHVKCSIFSSFSKQNVWHFEQCEAPVKGNDLKT